MEAQSHVEEAKNQETGSVSTSDAPRPESSSCSPAATLEDARPEEEAENSSVYRALVIDSGPIIRLTGLSELRGKAKQYYTVAAVLTEIRDAKARNHLSNLPFELIVKEASAEGIHVVAEFARQTGDYRNLSAVDLQVLGLLYDLEREGCGGDNNMSHVRQEPKRTVGVGKIQPLVENEQSELDEKKEGEAAETASPDNEEPSGAAFFETNPSVDADVGSDGHEEAPNPPTAPKTWAALVNSSAASSTSQSVPAALTTGPKLADQALNTRFGSMDISREVSAAEVVVDGQFSDAEEDFSDGESDDDGYADSDKEISDEECEVYILDPDEVEERKRRQAGNSVEEELKSGFPSLAASLHVPYDGIDNETEETAHPLGVGLTKEEAEAKRQEALRPVTKSGKLYNSFRKYRGLVKPEPAIRTKCIKKPEETSVKTNADELVKEADTVAPNEGRSRIIGGTSMSGQGTEVEDDGEGWITCTKDIRKMQASGKIDPLNSLHDDDRIKQEDIGPPVSKRAACATTDFAMQNVILQMNLELMSVDGIKIRRLKSWVTRCGSCFTVYADGDNVGPYNTKRLFCAKCGSDFLQRIAASVDGKTGRLRLHLSKKFKTNLRGTKYSLPKPGTGNRFQGDLLLREDQLLMGAWNQKVKQRSGGKSRRAAESMFGSDLASNVGCNAKLVRDSDINVGFGRRNPNASKFGRERRGKKKKSTDKACGLRRY